MLKEISPGEALDLLRRNAAVLVDVREPDEVEAVHVKGAIVAPISLLGLASVPRATAERPVIFTCHSGRRVRENAARLEKLAGGPCLALAGGMAAWEGARLPVVRGRRYSMERQVRMAAGGLVLAGALLSLWAPGFLVVPVFVGAGLVYAGLSGSCGMALVLARLPWNRRAAKR